MAALTMASRHSAIAWAAVWQKAFTQWGPDEWFPLAGAYLQPALCLVEGMMPLTLGGRTYQETTVRLLTPLPAGGIVWRAGR